MLKLYEIADEYAQLAMMAADADIDPEVFRDTLESVEGELEEKADAYANIIAVLSGEADTIQREIDRLTYLRAVKANRADALKRNLESCMLFMDKKKIKTDIHSFNIQKNAPSLNVLDERKIPAEYWIEQQPRLDKKRLLAEVKADPESFAGLAELKQTESLRIR